MPLRRNHAHKNDRNHFVIPAVFLLCLFSFKYALAEHEELERNADSLYIEATRLSDGYDYEGAIDKFKQALEIDRKTRRLQNTGTELHYIGLCYYSLSQCEQALAYYDSALVIEREVKDQSGEGTTLKDIGRSYWALGQYAEALAYFDTALVMQRKIGDKVGEAKTLNGIGIVQWALSQYEKALAYYDSALVIVREIENRFMEGVTLNNIGSVYWELSQYEKALAYYDSALVIKREVKDQSGEGRTLSGIGLTYSTLSQYDKALAYYDSSLVIAREVKDHNGEGWTLNNIGMTYYTLSQFEKALAYHDSALAIERKIKDRYGEWATLNNIGLSYDALSQYEKALAYHDSALVITREIRSQAGEGQIFNSIGSTYYALRQYDKALAYYDSALVIVRGIEDKINEERTLGGIGVTYDALSQYEKALAYYDSALVIAREIKDRYGEGWTLCSMGYVYETQKDLDRAISYYKESIEVKESIRRELRREESRVSFIEAEKDVYEQVANLLINLKRYEEAFDYMERSRSERLRKTYEESEIIAYDPSLRRGLERINNLEREKVDLEKKLRDKKIGKEEFEKRIAEVVGELNQKLLDLKTYHSQLYDIMEPQRRTLKDIQKTIPESTVFLEFASVEDKYVVFLITDRMFLSRAAGGEQKLIDNLVMEVSAIMKPGTPKSDLDERFAELYDMLIKPVENEIKDFKNIVVIPYGILHYLPFHCLRKQNERGKRESLLEWKPLSYLPSASFIVDILHGKTGAKKGLLAFGNADKTLPNAESEVDCISRIFPKSLAFKRENATKEQFIKVCGEYGLLHFATHGVLSIDPRWSYIKLAPEDEGDLTVREIAGLSGCLRSASLVTLSACETAIEKEQDRAGMELTALSNAFKIAGVPSVIASLWQVADSSTAVLMVDFYKNLKKGNMNKLEALRQAQIKMLQSDVFSHPFFWAPFVLIGNWR